MLYYTVNIFSLLDQSTELRTLSSGVHICLYIVFDAHLILLCKFYKLHKLHNILSAAKYSHFKLLQFCKHFLVNQFQFERIDFKLAVLAYKSLHGLTPPYLSDDCQLVTEVMGRRRLRSSDVYKCTVPRTQSQIRDRSFTAAGPRLWNSLPVERREQNITF